MSDAIFNSAGDVNGGSGRIASALAGSGGTTLPAIADLLSSQGRAPTQVAYKAPLTLEYHKPAPVDYQAIADQARAAQQSMLGFTNQSELQNYINQQVAEQLKNQGRRQVGGSWADNAAIKYYNETGKPWRWG
jgi:hypothetical protein